jgi:hypothetical protein
MTPTVREVLQGVAMVLATPSPPEAGPAYDASRKGMASTLAVLAAGEAERLAAATIAENADIRAELGAAADVYGAALGGRLAKAAAETDVDLATPALDGANARLRRLLIELHGAVEAAGDADGHRRIVTLYGRMALGRRLPLGG